MKTIRLRWLGSEDLVIQCSDAERDAIERALKQPHILNGIHSLGVVLLAEDKLRTGPFIKPDTKTTFSVRVDREGGTPVVVHLEKQG